MQVMLLQPHSLLFVAGLKVLSLYKQSACRMSVKFKDWSQEYPHVGLVAHMDLVPQRITQEVFLMIACL